jgi:hypothetical protein
VPNVAFKNPMFNTSHFGAMGKNWAIRKAYQIGNCQKLLICTLGKTSLSAYM